MDFFAAGGFQQLFSDLSDGFNVNAESPDSSHPAAADTVIRMDFGGCSKENESFHDDLTVNLTDGPAYEQYDFYDLLLEQKLMVHPQRKNLHIQDTDCNNRSINEDVRLYEKQFQQEFDFLLPAMNDQLESGIEANGYTTHKIAEWEEIFLDNYIELPELVDFLPEKTPLCTEMCDLHLQESSKQLQLNRKSKKSTMTAEKGYPCNFGNCQKLYAKPAHLKAHLRRHLGEKPYICTWPDCTWKFSRSDELARHRRSHSGVKPYKCDYCTKCFARSDHLTKHRKVHERRMLAASKAGKAIGGVMPQCVYTVRPGRKRKNQIC